MFKSFFVLLSTTLAFTSAIDCSVKELQPYNLELIKGIHSITTIKNTPPSKTNITWNLGICETINNNQQPYKDCPSNSDICGITSIILDNNKDNKDQIVYEVFGFNSNIQKNYIELGKDGEDGITIVINGVNWGDSIINADLTFKCDKNINNYEILSNEWDGKNLRISIASKGACITSDKDKKKDNDNKKNNDNNNNKKKDNGESWGWFTWIFIFLVLFLSIYIIGGAWFQYNKGNAIDFQSALKEVIENFIELLKGLPNFIREIIEKFTGNSSNRGDYSAV
ncbi:ATG27 [Candida pseudojiufengensis]|uniref:ATG27 n=1 Tax=Candida pseudojiufengensis TaxID=497109 RepID=UPI0022259870|nr:ATG27 [Candida pseudojiufengensis]KAI5965164.1 ATG27 [Candida pseudojiufengensis]